MIYRSSLKGKTCSAIIYVNLWEKGYIKSWAQLYVVCVSVPRSWCGTVWNRRGLFMKPNAKAHSIIWHDECEKTNSGLKKKSLPEEWGVLPDWLVSGVSMWFALTHFSVSALNNAVVWGDSEFVTNGCHTPRKESYSPPTVYAPKKNIFVTSYKFIFLIYTNKYTMWKPPSTSLFQ